MLTPLVQHEFRVIHQVQDVFWVVFTK